MSSIVEFDFGARQTWFKSGRLCHLPAVRLWASCLTSRIRGLVPYKARVKSFLQEHLVLEIMSLQHIA